MSSDETMTRPLSLWSSLSASLAFAALLGQAFDALPKLVLDEKSLWMTAFLPDVIVLLLLNAIAPLVLRRIAWCQSIARLRAQSTIQFALLCALMIGSLTLLIPLSSKVRAFYAARRDEARIDWHAVKALHLYNIRKYDAAAKELKLAAPASLDERGPVMQAEIDGRIKDAETLVRRFREHEGARRTPAFSELLMVGRAMRLAPQAQGVGAAMTDAQKILDDVIGEYVAGIRSLRNGDVAAAAERIRRSKTICRGFLHQELLLRYAENQNLDRYSAGDRGLIRHYLQTNDDQLIASLRAWPPVRQFAVTQ